MPRLEITITKASNGYAVKLYDHLTEIALHREFVYIAAQNEQLKDILSDIVDQFLQCGKEPSTTPKT